MFEMLDSRICLHQFAWIATNCLSTAKSWDHNLLQSAYNSLPLSNSEDRVASQSANQFLQQASMAATKCSCAARFAVSSYARWNSFRNTAQEFSYSSRSPFFSFCTVQISTWRPCAQRKNLRQLLKILTHVRGCFAQRSKIFVRSRCWLTWSISFVFALPCQPLPTFKN